MIPIRRRLLLGVRYREPFRRFSSLKSLKETGAPVDIHPEVEDALARNIPVVALETALVTHGLPHPYSFDVPLELEGAVRGTGAIPATIGLVHGRVKIGLEEHELERLATRTFQPAKISRRDVAAAIATKSDGGLWDDASPSIQPNEALIGTTCSATLLLASLAGIKVFATGGLGGVHRGGENSMDVSADLQELTRCPVGLVSSGVKSILDIGRTLEYLETAGVPVIAYGGTKEFPAFFSRHSGHHVPWNVEDPSIAAKMLHAQLQLGMKNGMLFAAPIPEQYSVAGELIQQCVNQAVRESEENGVAQSGKDATPWLLGRVLELSKGQSLESNIALLRNNAVIGGMIAVEYAKLIGVGEQSDTTAYTPPPGKTVPFSKDNAGQTKNPPKPGPVDIAVVGSAALDITAKADSSVNPSLAPHSTIPGSVSLTLGGVARNIAEASSRAAQAAYQGVSSVLVSPVGEDLLGHILTEEITRFVPRLAAHSPKYVAFDGNLDANSMQTLVHYCQEQKTQILTTASEPTSVVKSARILPTLASWLKTARPTQPLVNHFTPNVLELQHVYEEARSEEYDLMASDWWWDNVNSLSLGSNFRLEVEQLARQAVDDHDASKGTLAFLTERGIAQMAVHLLPFFQHIWIKCGAQGAIAVMQISAEEASSSGFANEHTNIAKRRIVAHGNGGEILVLQHFPPLKIGKAANVTGAGDTFVGALLAGIAHDGKQIYDTQGLESVVNTAQKAACLTLESHDAVSPLVSSLSKVSN
ncbi:indigoidine synthase A family protein [Coprinopsis cinerea okayama7|uniref:Indigoidine synthase A family protein n=1 Tax=Coprinopsis cinerea (strain Okayama-7 / 130 / ATCC MYA-4618 / FGSC 9003) TaxID=240176 RepID=D6RK37_COPC7|nr:indigoidine synthase A family protein [Coprinopsis cinerea okayama7\|eukprot:XP_002912103.1 indigoidine synthase A family protein [Coprinopsis cinerea okayama7\